MSVPLLGWMGALTSNGFPREPNVPRLGRVYFCIAYAQYSATYSDMFVSMPGY